MKTFPSAQLQVDDNLQSLGEAKGKAGRAHGEQRDMSSVIGEQRAALRAAMRVGLESK